MKLQVVNVSKLEFTGRNGEPVLMFRHTCLCTDGTERNFCIVNSRTAFQVNDILDPEVYVNSDNKLAVRVVKA